MSWRWGRVVVEAAPGPLRDAVLFPGGARAWDWRASGTGHRPTHAGSSRALQCPCGHRTRRRPHSLHLLIRRRDAAGSLAVLFPCAGVERSPAWRITCRKAVKTCLVDAVDSALDSAIEPGRSRLRVDWWA